MNIPFDIGSGNGPVIFEPIRTMEQVITHPQSYSLQMLCTVAYMCVLALVMFEPVCTQEQACECV